MLTPLDEDWPEFRHEAMATEFAITLATERTDYARQAAGAAWRELDRLETELSRYVESSDIARANRLRDGESIRVGHDALQCLIVAAGMNVATQGCFDVAYATERRPESPRHSPPFTLDPEHHLLTSHATALHLDLGAIGKGYALDVMAVVLREWELPAACLQSGGSTALLLDPPHGATGWRVGLGEGRSYRILDLSQVSLSGSGTAVKGQHLIDPRTAHPALRQRKIWALADTAAVSDALSTAFFVMPDEAVENFCREHREFGAAISTADETLALQGALTRHSQS